MAESSRLLNSSKEIRDEMIARNKFYKPGDEYDSSHSRAKSDGDEHGKGENNGSIGSKTDIITRNKLLASNKYKSGDEYDSSKA